MTFSTLIAQNIGNPALGNLATQNGLTYIPSLISALINLGFVAGAVFFIANLIMGGIKWTSSGGDKGKLEEARGQVTSAVIGIFVLLSAYAIMSLVEYFFGVNLTVFDLQALRVNVSGGGQMPVTVPNVVR